jgi:hypothetical protein
MTLFPRSIDTDRAIDLAWWLDAGLVLAVLLACAVAMSLNVADPDLWGHVQYGRDVLTHGFTWSTTYSYVAKDYWWINHEILSEIALAIGFHLLGPSGMLFAKCVLGFALISAFVWRGFRQEVSFLAVCIMAILVATTLGSHWSLRPQIASYVCFTLLLALLSYCFQGWEGSWQLPSGWFTRGWWQGSAEEPRQQSTRKHPTTSDPPLEYSIPRLKLLWLTVPLFVVWANSHGGFLAGLCVYLAYLGFRGCEAASRKGRAADGLTLRFGLMGAAAALATLLNPYGPLFHWWLYNDLKVPRPEILEWRAPTLLDVQFLPFWLLAAAAIGSVIASRRSRDFTHIAILGLLLWQSLTHHRHNAFFAIACAWWLPQHLDSLLDRLGISRRFKTDEELKYGWAPPESRASPLLSRQKLSKGWPSC